MNSATQITRLLLMITRLVRGGAQRELLELLTGLDRRRFQVELACNPAGEWVARAATLVDEFHPVSDLIRPISPWRDVRALAHVLRIMMRGRFDIVHTHTAKAGMVGRLAARLARVPVVVHTPHGTVFHDSYLSPRMQQVIARMERRAGRWTNCIITKSDQEAAEYIKLGIAPPSKFRTIHSDLDWQRLEATVASPQRVRQALGIPDGRPIVLYAARLVPEKDHATFLRAFETVLASVPNAVALFSGDGPLRGQIEAQAAHLIGCKALFPLGSRDDLPDLMRAADVCVSASRTEGLPLAVAEALALGRPVVATDAGGTSDIVIHQQTGLLVPCADPRALADAILCVLRNRAQAAQMGRIGREHVRSLMDRGLMVRRTQKLYQECLLGDGSAR